MAMAKRPMNLGQALKDYVKGGTPLPAAYKNYQKYADMQKQKFGPVTPRPAPPSGGAAAPVSGMGGAGGTQQMIKKGGMTKSSGRDGCAIRGKTRA